MHNWDAPASGEINQTFYQSAETLIKKYRMEIVSCLCSAFAAYMFVFSNKIPNWDDTHYLFAKGASLSSGRWGLVILGKILPNISIPWVWGWFSVLILIVSICIVLDLCQIKNKAIRCILAGLIMTFPSEAGTMLYMFTSSSYAISFLCSILSVILVQEKSIWKKIMAVAMLVFALGIYQAYISVAASLLVLLLIKMMLQEKSTYDVFRTGIGYLLFLAVSLIVYCVITYISLMISGEELNGWAVRATTTSGGMLHRIIRSWKLFVAMILFRDYGLITGDYSWICHILCVCCTAIAVLQFLFQKRNISDIALLFVLGIGFLPLSINALPILIGENGVHALTLYSFISVYLLIGIIWENIGFRQGSRKIVYGAFVVILLSNIYSANRAYFRQYMVYENTVAFYTSIVTQIQMTPGYDEDSVVAIIGDIDEDSRYLQGFGEETIYGINGFKSGGVGGMFIRHYLGVDLEYANEQQIEEIKETNEFDQMPCYPYYGFIQEIGNCIVVKIGD